MPSYTFENTKTGEVYEDSMSISEMESFLKKNKHIRYVFTPVPIVDPAGIGVSKPPADFQKHVLGRIKDKNPGASAIGTRRWNIPKEI